MYRSIFFLFLQAQRPTLEHTKVSEEPAEGVQVWWPEGHSSLVTKRLEPHRSQEIKGRHGCSAGEFNNNGNNRSSPKLLLRLKFVQPIIELIECIENFLINIKHSTLLQLIAINIYIAKSDLNFESKVPNNALRFSNLTWLYNDMQLNIFNYMKLNKLYVNTNNSHIILLNSWKNYCKATYQLWL